MTKTVGSGNKPGNELDAVREREETLKALLHLLPVGISILNRERKPIFTNPALEQILGLSGDELHGGNYRQRKYLRADGSEMNADEFPSARTFETGQAVQDIVVGIVKEDASTIWAMVSAIPLMRRDWQVLLTVVDITDRKQARDELQAQTAILLERVKELNCLYGISDLVEQADITLEEILLGVAELIPPTWHYPQLTCARVVYNGQEYRSKTFKTSGWQQNCDFNVHSRISGSVDVFYTGDVPESESGPFLKEEANLLCAIAERIGRIIERFQAEAKLVELATTDSLTGLYNRRHFFELAEIEIERSRRYGHPLSCIMFDIDHFKDFNDSHGHMFGDKVLQEMVRRCRENIRRVDIFARYGGDEFVILLPETGIRRARQLANRLRDGFQSHELFIDSQRTSITLSMGVASMNGDNNLLLDVVLNRADQALYASKGKGRNQVSVWSADN